MKKIIPYLITAAVLGFAGAVLGKDAPITTWLLDPVTPIAQEVRYTFWHTALITLPFLILPQVLLVLAMWKFRESRGHKPATFHENLKLEILWTVIPAITLVIISIPAYKVMRKMDVPPQSDLVVEVVGHQFFWEYRYPKYNVVIANEPLVVPAEKVVTLNCTSVDVNHAFWVPAFGIKQDAMAGRINHTWFKAHEGKYKGQCAELCGALHGEMLIDVKVLPEANFEEWIRAKAAANEEPVKKDTTAAKPAKVVSLQGIKNERVNG